MTDLKAKYVLVVEDEPRNAALISVMLKIAGVQHVYECRSGLVITPTVQQMPAVDLILLDLQLPGEDGYQIYKRLRADSAFSRTAIVAVTAQVMPDDVERADKAGFDGFLGKPLNFDRFPSQIQRLLSGERVWDPR